MANAVAMAVDGAIVQVQSGWPARTVQHQLKWLLRQWDQG
jgi:hypothetical protein